jgi:hypothetical protein
VSDCVIGWVSEKQKRHMYMESLRTQLNSTEAVSSVHPPHSLTASLVTASSSEGVRERGGVLECLRRHSCGSNRAPHSLSHSLTHSLNLSRTVTARREKKSTGGCRSRPSLRPGECVSV